MAKVNPWTEFATGFVERTNVQYAEKQKDYRDNKKTVNAARSAAKLKQIQSDIDTSTKRKATRAVATKYVMDGNADDLARLAASGIKGEKERAQWITKYQDEFVGLEGDEAVTKWLDTHFKDGEDVNPKNPKYDAYYRDLGDMEKPNHPMFSAFGYNPNKHLETSRRADATVKAEASYAGRAPAKATIDLLGGAKAVSTRMYRNKVTGKIVESIRKGKDKLLEIPGKGQQPITPEWEVIDTSQGAFGGKNIPAEPTSESMNIVAGMMKDSGIEFQDFEGESGTRFIYDVAALAQKYQADYKLDTGEAIIRAFSDFEKSVKDESIRIPIFDISVWDRYKYKRPEVKSLTTTSTPDTAPEYVIREIGGIKYKFDKMTKENLGKY